MAFCIRIETQTCKHTPVAVKMGKMEGIRPKENQSWLSGNIPVECVL